MFSGYGYERVCLTWLKQNVSFQSRVKHPCVLRYACVCVGEFDQHTVHHSIDTYTNTPSQFMGNFVLKWKEIGDT